MVVLRTDEGNLSLTESIAIEDYFLEVLCAQLDKAYQFALSLVGDPDQSYQLLHKVFAGFSNDMPLPGKDKDCVVDVFTEIWQAAQTQSDHLDKIENWPPHLTANIRGAFVLAQMSLIERAVLVLADHFNFYADDIVTILGMDHSSTYQVHLAQARQQMMSNLDDG